MTPKKQSKLVHYWADNHLVIFGNQYQLFDNYTQKILFQCNASSDIDASRKCYRFLRSEWEKI